MRACLLVLALLLVSFVRVEGEDAPAAEVMAAEAAAADTVSAEDAIASAGEGAEAAAAAGSEEAFYDDEDEEEVDEEEDLVLDEELSARNGAGAADAQQELTPEQREMQMRLQQQMVRYILEMASATCSSELRGVLGMTQVRTLVGWQGVRRVRRAATRARARACLEPPPGGRPLLVPRPSLRAGAAAGAAQEDGRQDVLRRLRRAD